MDSPEHPPLLLPVACTLTGTPGAFAERMAEYRRLFQSYLTGRSRTGPGIRFCFRAEPGVEDWVRDLARREKACCGFFDFTVTADAGEIRWDAAVADNSRPGRRWTSSTACPTPWAAGDQANEPYRACRSGS